MQSGTRPSIRMAAAIFCLLLVLVSLMIVQAHSHAANVAAQTVLDTNTLTPTGTPTSSPTPTPSPTPRPRPTPTPRPRPTPTPRPRPTPAPTMAATPTPAAVATVTPLVKMTATALPTATAGMYQTPTPPASAPTTTTNGGGNGTPTQNQPGNGNSSGLGGHFIPYIIGSSVFVVLVSGVLVSLLLVRKRLLPVAVPQQNLPRSGAQPWQRTRPASMHGNTNMYGYGNGSSPLQNQAPANAAIFNPVNGFPLAAIAPAPVAPNIFSGPGFSQPTSTGFANLQTSTSLQQQGTANPGGGPPQQPALAMPPATWLSDEQLKTSRRAATRLVKLEVQEHSSGALPVVMSEQAWQTDHQTDASFLRDTLKPYIQHDKQISEAVIRRIENQI